MQVLNPNNNLLTISISSRALFDMSESHSVFTDKGVNAYTQYQVDNEDVPLQPGPAFNLIKKLLKLNDSFSSSERKVDVILLSRNSGNTGLRVFNSIKYHKLDITRAAFCGGGDPWRYVRPFNSHLFLSLDPEDVSQALKIGVASGNLVPDKNHDTEDANSNRIHLAFDGDSVVFDDTADNIYQNQGLDEFKRNEEANSDSSLGGGPFKPLLAIIQSMQAAFNEADCPIRTALVTARGAPTHERVIRTLREWSIRIDESLFLGGQNKGEFLKAFGADIFFDDQQTNIVESSKYVPSAHVPPTPRVSDSKSSEPVKPKFSRNNPYSHWRKM